MSPGRDLARYSAIIPVKAFERAKARLAAEGAHRPALARAFALDVIAAVHEAARVGRVVVVSSEPSLAAELAGYGRLAVLPDPRGQGDPLNAAVRAGRSWLAREHPREPVVVVPADLPALTADALDDALRRAAAHRRAFCADTEGEGTTLLMAAEPRLLAPSYGPGSALAHAATGAVELTDVDPRVRRDVDTPGALREAFRLGAASRTQAVVSLLGEH